MSEILVDDETLSLVVAQVIKQLSTRNEGLAERITPAITAELSETLGYAINVAASQTPSLRGFIFVPTNPGVAKNCDMPKNGHRFTTTTKSKHCSNCKLDYCDQHPLTYCPSCGRTI